MSPTNQRLKDLIEQVRQTLIWWEGISRLNEKFDGDFEKITIEIERRLGDVGRFHRAMDRLATTLIELEELERKGELYKNGTTS